MKKLFIVLVILLIIVGAVFTYAAMNANSLIAKYKPDLEKVASDAVGSPVTLGVLTTTVFPTASIKIGEFKVGSKPGDSFTLNNLVLKIKLLALLSGALDIETLSIDGPTITVIKDISGITIAGLPKPEPKNSDGASPPPVTKVPAENTGTSSSPLKINLEQFALTNGSITFKDLVAKQDHQISDINVHTGIKIESSSITINSLEIGAQLPGKMPVKFEGSNITYGLSDGEVNAPKLSLSLMGSIINLSARLASKTGEGDFKVTSDGINLAKLDGVYAMVPALQALDLKGAIGLDLAGKLSKAGPAINGAIQLLNIGLTSSGYTVSEFNGPIKVGVTSEKQSAILENVPFKINDQPLTLSLNGSLDGGTKANLNSLSIDAFGGNIGAKAALNLGEEKDFTSTVNIKGIDLEQALKVPNIPAASQLSGTLSNFDVEVAGRLGPDLMQTLRGKGGLAVAKCLLKGINLPGAVLQTVNNIPFISGSLYSAVPQESQGEVSSNNTSIDSITTDFTLENGALITPNLKIASKIFSLDSDGKVGFDSSLDLNSTIAFSQEFSKALTTKNKEIEKLLDTDGRLVIPLSFKGTPPKVAILPNLSKILEIAGRKALKDNAGKLLDGVLKGKKDGKGGLGGILGF